MKFTKNTISQDIAKRLGDNELKIYKAGLGVHFRTRLPSFQPTGLRGKGRKYHHF